MPVTHVLVAVLHVTVRVLGLEDCLWTAQSLCGNINVMIGWGEPL